MTPIYTSEGQSSPLKDELDSQLSSLFTWLDIHTTSSPNPTCNVRSACGAISSRPSCCGNLILAHTDFVRQQRPLQNIGSEAECDFATLPADATAAKGLRRRRRRRRQSNVKPRSPGFSSVRMTWVDLVGLLSNESMARDFGGGNSNRLIESIDPSTIDIVELTTLRYDCEHR